MITYNTDPRLMALFNLIGSRKDWKEVITKEPYFVKVREKDNLVLLKYDQYNSDLGNDIVQACRGIILDTSKIIPRDMVVCQSFYKFFNQGERKFTADGSLGEELAYKIDYEKPHEVQEKLDGSMLRLWFYNGKWNVSTSGMIDANEATIQGMDKTYGELFWETLEKYYPNREVLDMLNKDWCYTFELISPEAKLVVRYDESKLYLLSAFDLRNLQELNIREIDKLRFLKFEVPKIYPDSFMKSMENLDNFEGCVIVQVDDDGVIQRVKLKTKNYMELFWLRGNNGSDKELLKAIIDGSIDDKLTAFPEYSPRAEYVKKWLNEQIAALNTVLDSCHYDLERPVFAANYAKLPQAGHCFRKYDNPNYKAEDFYLNMNNFNRVWDMFRSETE